MPRDETFEVQPQRIIKWPEPSKDDWSSDPIVLAIKNQNREPTILLDKDALAIKLLEFADEKIGRSYVAEAKDRLAALRLYAEVQGYIGKIDINASTNNTINAMTIKFVKPENQDNKKIINNEINEVVNDLKPLPLNIKLVK